MGTNLHCTNVVPRDFKYQLLEDITDNFSEEHKVGTGGYGTVYKGVMRDGEVIAVKKLSHILSFDDKQFMQEFTNLMRAQHPKIVRLVGYCYETMRTHIEINGQYTFADRTERVLCFEYLQHGSLDKHLSDELCGLEWSARYKIIKGICEGLNYLHGGLEKPVFHLDLKPSNILLDNNMEPKIADFGLSRFFLGSKTHKSTTTVTGTVAYMPPEFMNKREISNKYDIFSLGMIIIQIITGPEGYSRYLETSPQEFIELVQSNWRNRMKATSVYANEYCQQVKRCMEIAVDCLEIDRKKRPAIGRIMDELIQTEKSMPIFESRSLLNEGSGASDENVVLAKKFGPWGGNAGKIHDIKVAPHRLESVTIWSAVFVDAIAFSYSELNGMKHTIGTWGGPGGFTNRIQFGPSEYLVEISGTTGPFISPTDVVIKSLKLATNVRSYGPFGHGGEIPFRTSVQDNGSIIGFFGRSARFLNAIGVYVNPNRLALAELEIMEEGVDGEENAVTKIGPWGGIGGMPYDIEVNRPHRLESMTIYSDEVIRSITFSYIDVKGKQHNERWGGPGGSANTIPLGRFEHIKGISGTFSQFNRSPSNVITSLTISTHIDNNIYGPFGQGGGSPFTVPVDVNGWVVGFFGRAGSYLDALGVYMRTY